MKLELMFRYIVRLPWSERQRQLAAKRPRMTKDQFVAQSGTTELGMRAAALLWEELQPWRAWDSFTPYPYDDFGEVFGLGEGELDEDIILQILRALNVPTPGDHEIAMIGKGDMAKDLVRLIEASMPSNNRWRGP